MHRLARQVRFSINPFLREDVAGSNSFASNPTGEGLAVFLELGVALAGQVDSETGFVVNVLDIDEQVRREVVPMFAGKIRDSFRRSEHIGITALAKLLCSAAGRLKGKFGKSMIADLTLKLNPFRKLAIDCEDMKMVYLSEKFEFAATHRLWNEKFSQEKNFEIFGKCANPAGHGHNYAIEVTVKWPADKDMLIGTFEKVVDGQLIKLIDHKNLNEDVEHFSRINPTVENLAVFAWGRLAGKFEQVKLHCVTVWETDKTCCSYYG